MSDGMPSETVNFAPSSSPDQTIDFLLSKSTIPLKVDSTPMGKTIIAGFAPNLSSILFTVAKKSAPNLSILFTKQILGTLYLSACLQTVSDCD